MFYLDDVLSCLLVVCVVSADCFELSIGCCVVYLQAVFSCLQVVVFYLDDVLSYLQVVVWCIWIMI